MKPKILLAEADGMFAEAVAYILEQAGFETLSVRDSRSTLRFATEFAPDLISSRAVNDPSQLGRPFGPGYGDSGVVGTTGGGPFACSPLNCNSQRPAPPPCMWAHATPPSSRGGTNFLRPVRVSGPHHSRTTNIMSHV